MSVLHIFAEMYACRVACCPLVSHGEYADGTDTQMDGRQAVTLCFPSRRGQRNYRERYLANCSKPLAVRLVVAIVCLCVSLVCWLNA